MKSLNPNDVIDSIAKRIELKKQLRTTKGDDILVDESLKKEIAKIVFDISGESWSNVNGQIISVNGGIL